MPTTKQEAVKITEIFNDYLTELQAQEITQRLHEEVATQSENTSLVVSIEMLRALYHHDKRKQFIRKMVFLKLLLLTVVIVHFAILFFNFIAFFILPFITEWYIALPLMTLIVNFSFSSTPCPLTKLEDNIRHTLGMPRIKLFMGHYVIWPVKEWINDKKRNNQSQNGSTGLSPQ